MQDRMKIEDIERSRLENMCDTLLSMCLHFCGAQYTETILRDRGFRQAELEAVSFDIDGEWADMDPCMEV